MFRDPEFVLLLALRRYCLQRGTDEYDYWDHENCALAQFLIHTGRATQPHVFRDSWIGDDGTKHPLHNGLIYAVPTEPHTFAALADRIEAVLPAIVHGEPA